MPIYEYKCSKCSQVFEIFHKITEKKAQKCARCGSRLERLISQTSFALKGEGWYKDGYTKKSASPAHPTEKKKEIEKKDVKKE
ncbi:MAG: zinc ribbon domain-containing protein [Deltaproteobacteria bacterium]|nr:zinc ribbon domain-containing protein [Deltaproteobacteria bacterium]